MNNQELHELAKKIAPELTYEYVESENRRDGELNSYARISRGDAGALWLNENEGKLHVSVAWPRGGAEEGWKQYTVSQTYRKPEDTKVSSIKVSASKPVKQIAKDICRRLLHDAEALYQEAHKMLVDERDYVSARRAAIAKLRTVVEKDGRGRGPDDGHFWFPIGNSTVDGEVTVSSATCIKVEVSCRNAEEAEKVIAFAKTLREAK